ncbi:hypothetical protein KDW88_35910, partial [Burkholderia cenocepacia]|nr:hypothetical protein [Burkholderia cenocepacia]
FGMPLREVLFGVSVATLVPTTLVGTTLATSFHIVETVLGTRLQLGVEGVGSNRNRLLEIGQMHLARRDACTPATDVAEITNLLFFVCVGGHQGRGEKSPWTTSPE